MNSKDRATYQILYQTWRECCRDATRISAFAGYEEEDAYSEMTAWDAEDFAYNELLDFILTHDLKGTEYDVQRDGWD